MLTMSGFLKKELLHKGQLDVKYMDIPEEFQVLTWIKKNTSNGYLDTKYIPIDKSIIRTTVILDEWFSDTTNRIMGVDMGSDAVDVGIRALSTSGTPRGFYGYHDRKFFDSDVVAKLNTQYKIELTPNCLKLNDVEILPEPRALTQQITDSYWLFCANMSSSTESNSYKKEIAGGFKRTQILEGSTLIKDMIPVYNKTTKYYGMYDVVNKEFLPASNKTAFFGA